MKMLVVKKITDKNFFLVEDKETNKKQDLIFDFFSDEKPDENDIICMDRQLLDTRSEYFAQPFCYELVGEENMIMKRFVDKDPTEYLILIKNNKRLLFRRIYG